MKKLILVLPTLALLGGCVSTGMPALTPAMAVQDVQIAARFLCGVEPTGQQVASRIAANNPGIATAFDVARIICGIH